MPYHASLVHVAVFFVDTLAPDACHRLPQLPRVRVACDSVAQSARQISHTWTDTLFVWANSRLIGVVPV